MPIDRFIVDFACLSQRLIIEACVDAGVRTLRRGAAERCCARGRGRHAAGEGRTLRRAHDTKVEFHFDFGSPNAYFSHKLIPGIEQRTGAKFVYVPILLGGVFKATGNVAPMVAFKDVKGKLAYQRLETLRFIKKHGLTRFKMNPHFPVNTVQVMRGAVAAEADGQLEKYVDAVFRLMWEDEKKMDDA